MKSKKKLLLMGVGVMGALAMGVGATSTFAWFQANAAATISALTNNQSAGIQVNNHASVDGMNIRLKLSWSALTKVDLTAGVAKTARVNTEDVDQEVGKSYVIDQNGNVKLNTNASVVKYAVGTVTLPTTPGTGSGNDREALIERQTGTTWREATNEEVGLLSGKVITIKITASNQVRVMGAGTLTEGAVGEAATYTGQEISLGTATVTTVSSGTITWTYASSYSDSDHAATAGIHFRYSVSPKDDDGNGEYIADDGSTTDVDESVYGGLTVSFSVTNP